MVPQYALDEQVWLATVIDEPVQGNDSVSNTSRDPILIGYFTALQLDARQYRTIQETQLKSSLATVPNF